MNYFIKNMLQIEPTVSIYSNDLPEIKDSNCLQYMLKIDSGVEMQLDDFGDIKNKFIVFEFNILLVLEDHVEQHLINYSLSDKQLDIGYSEINIFRLYDNSDNFICKIGIKKENNIITIYEDETSD